MKKILAGILLTLLVSTVHAEDCGCCDVAPKAYDVKNGFETIYDTYVYGQFVPGGKFFYSLQGKDHKGSPTLVFLHYLEGSHRAFQCQQSQFSKFYRTLSIDLRGRGDSVKTDPATFTYTNQALASDVHQLLEKLHIDGPLVLIGSVSGGYTALKYIELYSTPSSPYNDRKRPVTKLVMINSGPGLTTVPDCAALPNCTVVAGGCSVLPEPNTCPQCDTAGPCGLCFDAGTVTAAGYCEGLKGFYFATPENYNLAACCFGLGVFDEPCPGLENAQLAFTEDFLKTTPAIQESLYTAALAEDLRSVVETLCIPTLVCYGTISDTPAGASIYLYDTIPGSILASFNKGEQPQITDWVNFNTLFGNFLDDFLVPGSQHTYDDPACCICPCYVPTVPVSCSAQYPECPV